MNCDICSREQTAALSFYCVACARGTVYIPRVESAKVLLEKEGLGNQIESIPKDGSSKPKIPPKASTSSSGQVWSTVIRNAQKAQSLEKVQSITEHLKQLRKELEETRRDIATRRATIANQKANLDGINSILADRRRLSAEKLTDTTGKGSRTYDSLHRKTSETRAFLCQEAAILLRFKQKKRKKDGVVKDHYSISGLPVVDLKDISGLRCAEISASLSSITHLLNLASFYLSVRLPAEITIPHRDYPLPTIFTPANSYLARSVQFPGTSPHSASSTPSASKHGEHKVASRPRPLFIIGDDDNDKVVQVARKEPAAFAFFVEGLSLLAWDVAWLCRSQGFTAGTETWEDVCNIGRNLWQLFLSPPQPSALMRVLSSRDVQDRNKLAKDLTIPATSKPKHLSRLGEYSHSSAHSFLGAQGVQELFRSWKVAKHTMIADPLKKALWAEMKNAEWELLQEQEWDDGGEQFDDAIFIKTRLMDGQDYDNARSIMAARPSHMDAPDPAVEIGDSARAKGTSGWTKVKSRDK